MINFDTPTSLSPFYASFLTIAFAVTTFSVMFSMAGFNSSAYRQFHRVFPRRLLWSCITILLLATVPLIALLFRPTWYVVVCLVSLPFLAMGSVGLLAIARRETDPLILLNRLCSRKRIAKYLDSLIPEVDLRITETESLKLSHIRDAPSHEFNWQLPLPTQRDDPLNQLTTLGLLAIQVEDVYAFAQVLRRSLEIVELKFEPKGTTAEAYRVGGTLHKYAFQYLDRLVAAVERDKAAISLSRAAIDTFAEFAVNKTKARRQTEDITFSSLEYMVSLSKHCYENGSLHEIRIPLIVSRQLVQKGIDDPPKAPSDGEVPIEVSMFHHDLAGLLWPISRIGSYAVEKHDAELLYRCFDALGYLGCAALKKDKHEIVSSCLRALAQLGREARAEKLECFWARCALRPEDHAVERINWIASWVSKVPDDQRQGWLDLMDGAYSRLSGNEIRVSMKTGNDGKPIFTRKDTGKKYVERYMLNEGSRDVDYSDLTFLKDLEFHGFMGSGIAYMQGPVMPLISSDVKGEV